MSVIIAGKSDAELRLVKEMIDTGQEMLRMNDKRRQELKDLHIPMDVNVIFKKITDDNNN